MTNAFWKTDWFIGASISFLFLLAWAFLTGQFKDIERAKYEMLERFEEQERAERLAERRAERPMEAR